MHPLRRYLASPLLLLCGILLTGGCALLHPSKKQHPAPTSPPSNPIPGAKSKGFFYHITHPLADLHPFARKASPPKAVALRRVGTIRTISKDGSFVIVELEPGVMVSPGSELLVTATGGEPAHLKVSDVQSPYFVADIVSGNPEPEDPVEQ